MPLSRFKQDSPNADPVPTKIKTAQGVRGVVTQLILEEVIKLVMYRKRTIIPPTKTILTKKKGQTKLETPKVVLTSKAVPTRRPTAR